MCVLLSSCVSAPAVTVSSDEIPSKIEHPSPARIQVVIKTPPGLEDIERLDLFIYEEGGVQQLVSHTLYDRPPGIIELDACSSPVLFAAVANCPFEFNTEALKLYSSLESLSFNLSDDLCAKPVLTGLATAGQSEDTFIIAIEPLRAEIRLRSVTNRYGGDSLIEEPKARLSGINTACEAFRWSGWYGSEPSDTPWQPLPCWIGLYTQYPGTTLYCYPNDASQGPGAAFLELSYRYEGRDMTKRISLPRVGRGETIGIDVDLP